MRCLSRLWCMRRVPGVTRPFSTHFIDRVTLTLQAGNGGAGNVSFARGPNLPIAPPDGGHGGRGGSIIFECETNASLNIPRTLRAGDGGSGEPSRRNGRSGADLVVSIPPGTVIYSDGIRVAELSHGERAVLARGGDGGRGNVAFKSSRMRTPRGAEPGASGQQRRVEMVLRTIADVGLVGAPNAGKSTLLRAVSRATPRVAHFPFTTVRPHVAVMHGRGVCIADIPGLVDGAHGNRGLGHDFLRHVERTSLLVFVVDASAPAPAATLSMLRRELELHQEGLSGRAGCLVANKMDLPKAIHGLDELLGEVGNDMAVFPVSARYKHGIDELIEHVEACVPSSSDSTPDGKVVKAISNPAH